MLEEPHEMVVADVVKEPLDVGLDHPLGLLVGDDLGHPRERVVRTPPRSEAIGAVAELGLPDRLQHLTEPVLDQPVLEGGNAQRAIPPIPFWDIGAAHRLRAIPQSTQATRQIGDALVEALAVGVLAYPVDSGRLPPILALEARMQALGLRNHTHEGVEAGLGLSTRLVC